MQTTLMIPSGADHYHNHGHIHGSTELPQHTHTIATHAHGMVAHNHTTPNHAHTIGATHNHTSPQHVHTLPALTESFALKRVPALTSYVMSDLEYSVNGGTWAGLETGVAVGSGYFEIDVTSLVQKPGGLRRPWQEDNLVQVRRKTASATGKTAMIRVKLGIRCTVQSIVQYA